MHKRVRGELTEPAGRFPAGTPYAADDPALLLWILATLVDSGLLVYQRYVLESLPVSKFAATSFIAIAPTAIIAVALFKMMHLFEAGTPIDIDPHAVKAFSVLGILAAWGFAAWAFVMAVVIVISYVRDLDLPYALSWWAYTLSLIHI